MIQNTIDTENSFEDYLFQFRSKIQRLFSERDSIDRLSVSRGLPPYMMREILSDQPLSVFIPKQYGGRGNSVAEGIQMVSAISYESLPLGLVFGINWGLFLQPLLKYGEDDVKRDVTMGMMRDSKLGGLMITEPGHGSDALNMQSFYVESDNKYHLQGVKHWAGLTGWADYWLLTARKKSPSGNLQRDIDFFVCDNHKSEEMVKVEEYFHNLGLYMIPYGKNKLDVKIPMGRRLIPHSTGVAMMLDSLHRNRMLLPAIAQGFIQRMMEEAFLHCNERMVGNKPLTSYDQVVYRIVSLQAAYTVTSAMCSYASKYAGSEHDLTGVGLYANAMKAYSTDLMQEASQTLFQLTGAKAYKLDHIAGRSIVDSRPFQIFEGPNDILYIQTAELLLKEMRLDQDYYLGNYLRKRPRYNLMMKELSGDCDFELSASLSQRKLYKLGQLFSKIMALEMVIALASTDFQQDLIRLTIDWLRYEIRNDTNNLNIMPNLSFVDLKAK